MSREGYEKDFDTIEELYEWYESRVCKSCKWKKADFLTNIEENRDKLSEEEIDEIINHEIPYAFPDNYEQLSVIEKLDWLRSTACGLEYATEGVEFPDHDC